MSDAAIRESLRKFPMTQEGTKARWDAVYAACDVLHEMLKTNDGRITHHVGDFRGGFSTTQYVCKKADGTHMVVDSWWIAHAMVDYDAVPVECFNNYKDAGYRAHTRCDELNKINASVAQRQSASL